MSGSAIKRQAERNSNGIPFGRPKKKTRRPTEEIIPLASGEDLQLRRLSLPETYHLLTRPDPQNTCGGRPGEWPIEFGSALSALRLEYPSVRKLAREIAGSKVLIAAIWDGVLEHGTPRNDHQYNQWLEMRARFAFPSRATISRWLNSTARRPKEELLETNTDIAVELGYFDSGKQPSVLGVGRALTADGTVYRGPTRNSARHSVDKETGEIYPRRFDPASKTYTDGTGEKVWGPKMAILGLQALPQHPYGISLAINHVSKYSPAHEADTTVELVESVVNELARYQRMPTALVSDGAPDGIHAALLASIGMGLISPPQRKAAPKKGDEPVDREHNIGTFDTGTRRVKLRLRGSNVHELVNVAGKYEEREVAQTFKNISRTGSDGSIKQHAYLKVTTKDEESILIPFTRMNGRNGRPEETDDQYLKRMSLMRAAGRDREDWKLTYGPNRGTAERANKGDDDAMPNQRIPAYGHHRQQCWVADRKMALALDLLASHRIHTGIMKIPEYPNTAGALAA